LALETNAQGAEEQADEIDRQRNELESALTKNKETQTQLRQSLEFHKAITNAVRKASMPNKKSSGADQ